MVKTKIFKKVIYSNIGWERVLLIIFPYIFIVGSFQLMGMLIMGVDFNEYDPATETSNNI